MSHRIWNRGSNGLPKLVQPYAPSILIPVRHPVIGPGKIRLMDHRIMGFNSVNGSGVGQSHLIVHTSKICQLLWFNPLNGSDLCWTEFRNLYADLTVVLVLMTKG